MNHTTEGKQIVIASSLAFFLATVLLVSVVLPAEYGWDPLGTGAALGLTGMSESGTSPLHAQSKPQRSDRIEFQLAPFEGVEYKYRLEAGDVMLYRWRATGEVIYDMHAEPDGAAEGYAETFDKSRAGEAKGSYTAPFPGIHGWLRQKRGQEDVTVTLESSGFYSGATEFRDGREFDYGLNGQP
jgi:hypothetical protein